MIALCSAELFGYRLRPVMVADATFVLALRTKLASSPFLRHGDPSLTQQTKWILEQHGRQDDLYFIIESAKLEPLGTIGLYHIHGDSAQWGRWAIIPESLCAPVALILLLDLAFFSLNMQSVFSETHEANRRTIGMKEFIGHRMIEPSHVPGHILSAVPPSAVCHRGDRSDWTAARGRLLPLARRADIYC